MHDMHHKYHREKPKGSRPTCLLVKLTDRLLPFGVAQQNTMLYRIWNMKGYIILLLYKVTDIPFHVQGGDIYYQLDIKTTADCKKEGN